jgi:hypothetical protein
MSNVTVYDSFDPDMVKRRLDTQTEKGYRTCWRWVGVTNREGIGLIRYQGRLQQVHRVAYLIHVGEIPDGWIIWRSCYDPACWYPEHMEAITRGMSRRRAWRKANLLPPRPDDADESIARHRAEYEARETK